MSITDELRGFMAGADGYELWCPRHKNELTAIADRIDAEHERVVRERRRSCVYYDPERHYCSCHDFDVSGYVELPKDADGEVWNVGDLAVGKVNPNNPKEVERMFWYGPDSGWQLETDTIIFPCPERVRHHHAPTIEDVLREFAEKITDSQIPNVHPTYEEAITEYAQRLQLREVDE